MKIIGGSVSISGALVARGVRDDDVKAGSEANVTGAIGDGSPSQGVGLEKRDSGTLDLSGTSTSRGDRRVGR